MPEENVRDINDVEIFATGNWKGDEYTEQDLDDMVTCFHATKDKLKPYIKLGHDNNQVLLQQDGMPAAGWVTDLKRSGGKLVANIKNVPRKIADLIDKKAYGRFSSEIFWNGKIDNKTYRRGVKAVALLGANTPAVQTLNDFINLYIDDSLECETVKSYHNMENDMEDVLKTLQDQIKNYTVEIGEAHKKEVSLSLKITDLEKQIGELNTKIQTNENEKAEIARKAKESEVKLFIDNAVKEFKIAPAKVQYFTDKAMQDFDFVKEIVKNLPKITESKEESQYIDRRDFTEDEKFDLEDKHDAKIKEYAEKNKVPYREAYVKVMEAK